MSQALTNFTTSLFVELPNKDPHTIVKKKQQMH